MSYAIRHRQHKSQEIPVVEVCKPTTHWVDVPLTDGGTLRICVAVPSVERAVVEETEDGQPLYFWSLSVTQNIIPGGTLPL